MDWRHCEQNPVVMPAACSDGLRQMGHTPDVGAGGAALSTVVDGVGSGGSNVVGTAGTVAAPASPSIRGSRGTCTCSSI